MNHPRPIICLTMVFLIGLILACGIGPSDSDGEIPTATRPPIATATPPDTTPPRPPVAKEDKWALWTEGTQLRGANIWQRVVVPDLDGPDFLGDGHVGPPYTQDDLNRLAALGANYVNISGPGLFTEQPPYTLDEQVQANLDNLLHMIAQADMFAVITFRTGPGRSDFTFYREGAGDWFDEDLLIEWVWEDQDAQDGWVEMWRYAAQRYKDNPIVVGYDLMCEPNSAGTQLEIWEPDEFYPAYAGTLYDWNQLYPRITSAIRQVDAETPILVGGMGWSAVRWLPYLEPTGHPCTVYMVHQYEPQMEYTHQEPPAENAYPGEFDLDWDGEPDPFDRDWLDEYLSTIGEFQDAHDVPVAVNEFGLVRWVPGASDFVDDQMALFEQRGMNHALWVWDPYWEPWTEEVNAFNFRYGPDPNNDSDVESDLQDVIVKYWGRNTVRPSDFAAPALPGATAQPHHALADVSHWFYVIDVNLESDLVEQIAASEYDLVVLDFIPSEENNTDYPMAEVVTQLHDAPHPKLVVAYIDVAEAEEYRTYWQEGWGVGNPAWIAGDDPDGWEGNFPVAYWYDEWREIWLGEGGYLQAILDAGFDGVYLDWVEAYSDENVIVIAEREGVDPLQEMIWWVEDIANFTRARRPDSDFVVIAQNAAELAEHDDYLTVIDGIAQEQVWFDGGTDNDPPGDCPLPRTDAEVDTDTYRASLSEPCRRVYDNYPDSTLHVSSEEYLRYLTLAQRKGMPIFTVDYALDPETVAWVYETSRALGFVPFVSNRALDRYVEPVH
jgi:uncharacterized protein (TIGR01370 family)